VCERSVRRPALVCGNGESLGAERIDWLILLHGKNKFATDAAEDVTRWPCKPDTAHSHAVCQGLKSIEGLWMSMRVLPQGDITADAPSVSSRPASLRGKRSNSKAKSTSAMQRRRKISRLRLRRSQTLLEATLSSDLKRKAGKRMPLRHYLGSIRTRRPSPSGPAESALSFQLHVIFDLM
jgi:hypothetical protein